MIIDSVFIGIYLYFTKNDFISKVELKRQVLFAIQYIPFGIIVLQSSFSPKNICDLYNVIR